MGLDNVILSPHIGGSTAEAQERIGVEVARKLIEYSDVGTTLGAVNFPQVQLPPSPLGTRFMHVHRNVPGIMTKLNETFLREQCNITGQFLQTESDIGYVVIDADTKSDTILDNRILLTLRSIEGTIRAHLIYKD